MKYKVVVVSDSHGLKEELQTIQKRHDADLFIHCGDSELEESDPVLAGYEVVKGNCDWFGTFREETELELGGLRFYATHGHLYDVKRSLQKITYRALEVDAHIVCFGHSHVAYAEKNDGVLLLNPGSIRAPRKFSEPSYIFIEWNTPQQVHVHFYHPDGRKLDLFPYDATFSL